jgi:hypothetical protein
MSNTDPLQAIARIRNRGMKLEVSVIPTNGILPGFGRAYLSDNLSHLTQPVQEATIQASVIH